MTVPALTGDVTTTGLSNVTTIGALRVVNSMIANGTIDLTAKVANTLPVAHGGTNTASLTAYELLAADALGTTVTQIPNVSSGPVGSGAFLMLNVGSFPTWQTITPGLGTVTSVSVVSANGFAGTVATATTTPAITLSTSVTGMVKGNGTAISAATAGTDYSAGTSGLATGVVYSTTGSGALSVISTASGSSGQFLQWGTPPTWQNISGTGTVTSVTGVGGRMASMSRRPCRRRIQSSRS